MIDVDSLSQKGWTKKEIDRVRKLVENSEPTKGAKIYSFADRVLYWIGILFAITVNIFVSVLIIPYMIVALNDYRAYLFSIFVSFMFGLFFDLLIHNMNVSYQRNAVVEGLFIPAMAIVNVFFIYQVIVMSNLVTVDMVVVLVSLLLYTLFFSVPYLVGVLAKKVQDRE